MAGKPSKAARAARRAADPEVRYRAIQAEIRREREQRQAAALRAEDERQRTERLAGVRMIVEAVPRRNGKATRQATIDEANAEFLRDTEFING